jgi:tetratricopeptide (TPR) repeat protein
MRAMSGVLIQEWWREIGIPVTAKPTSFGEIVHKTFEAMTFDWYILGWRIGGAGYPDHMRYFFHSDQAVPDGNNPMSYRNPQVDKYLEDLMTLCDRDELIFVSYEAQKMIIDEVGYCPLYYRSLNEAHRNDTFTGWFTQLGGIAGSESPRSCLLYLKPLIEEEEPPVTTEPPETEKEQKAMEYEDKAETYEAEAQNYEQADEWEKAAKSWEKAAENREKAAETWGNPTNLENARLNYRLAGIDWSNAAESWEVIEEWRDAARTWGNAADAFTNSGDTDAAAEASKRQEEAEENAGSYFCIVTVILLVVALIAAGVIYSR